MNILYGLAGEGFGHSSRALVVAKYLEEKGHKVILVTYGQAYKVLKGKFKIFKIKGPHLIFEKGKLSKFKTWDFNAKHLPKNLLNWRKFDRLMSGFKPDICISDMELIVPILSNWYNLPLISLDNQHRLVNCIINVPEKYNQDYLLAKMITERFVSAADYYVITSLSMLKTKTKNTFVVPPIIRNEVKKLKTRNGNFILVYLTKKNPHVLDILKSINGNFIVYGYNKRKKKGNIEFRKRETFIQDLASCKAIIATSGFTLISEALYLKKPYLALPLEGQFEQVLNALEIKQAGFGDYSEKFNEHDILDFSDKLQEYRKNLKNYNPDYNALYRVLDKILRKIKRQSR